MWRRTESLWSSLRRSLWNPRSHKTVIPKVAYWNSFANLRTNWANRHSFNTARSYRSSWITKSMGWLINLDSYFSRSDQPTRGAADGTWWWLMAVLKGTAGAYSQWASVWVSYGLTNSLTNWMANYLPRVLYRWNRVKPVWNFLNPSDLLDFGWFIPIYCLQGNIFNPPVC